MCNYCGSPHEKYGYCLKCQNEICEDCAALTTSRIFQGRRPQIHKAGHCWGHRYSQLLDEIRDKAEEAYQESRGTPTEEIAIAVKQEVQKWEISDQKQMTLNVETLIFTLKAKIPDIEVNKFICDKIDDLKKEKDLVKQYALIPLIIALIPREIIMGDVFKNINNATIINKSIVENSFNKVKKEHNEEVAKALVQIAGFIEQSGDINAATLYDKFNEELNKPNAEKSTLRKLWGGIEKTLPSIATISEVVAKLAPLF